jgi:hypothetical protein
MNEKGTLTTRAIKKIANVVSDALVHQAEQGINYSKTLFLSEAEIPADLISTFKKEI